MHREGLVLERRQPEFPGRERRGGLSQIAPTIPLLGDEEVDTWLDIATGAGRVLDDREGATAKRGRTGTAISR